MKPTAISISAHGLANIQVTAEHEDFECIIAESHYRCPRFIANFLSPRVRHLHLIHNMIRRLIIDPMELKGEFSESLLLGRTCQIIINNDNRNISDSLIEELENDELSTILFETGRK
jgi:hypothetical protein